MRIKYCMAACMAAALLLCGCKATEEEIVETSSVYSYIEPSENLFVTETSAEVQSDVTVTTTAEAILESEPATDEMTVFATTPVPETVVVTETVTSEPVTEAETTTVPQTTAVTVPETTEGTTTTTVETTTEAETTTESVAETEKLKLFDADYTADEEFVKIGGRTFVDRTGALILSNTYSYIEFAFCGTYAEVTLTSDCIEGKARVGIFVNGERVDDVMLTKSKTTVKVFESEVPKECIVSVVKLSEQGKSYAGVKKISAVTEYGIVPTPQRERRIEFVGDSITCGYGIDAPNENYEFSTETEDGSKAYAALIGKALDADVNVVAWSGIGAYSCSTSGENPSQWKLISQVYENTDTMHTAEKWDFSQWQPDVVVINIGTNDNSWTRGIDERVDLFGDAYYDFICQVRRSNPDAYIICALGVMGNQLMPEITEQVELYKANTGDERVEAYEIANQSGKDGFGAGYHPSVKTHQKMADSLSAHIAEIMNW